MVWEDPLTTMLSRRGHQKSILSFFPFSSSGLGKGSEGRGKSKDFGILFIYLL